jgi:hypothetical protein
MASSNEDCTMEEENAPSLPKLLAALALGARSCNSLPVSSTRDEDEEDDESASENDEDDEFAYQMAFREFNSLCLESRSELTALLNQSLQSTATATVNADNMLDDYEFDDPRLWLTAAEACDVLLERVDLHIQNVKEGRVGLDGEKLGEAIGRVGDMARNKAKGGFHQLIGSLVEMEVRDFIFSSALWCQVCFRMYMYSHFHVLISNGSALLCIFVPSPSLYDHRNPKSRIISRAQYKTLGKNLLFHNCTPKNLSPSIHPTTSSPYQGTDWRVGNTVEPRKSTFNLFLTI